MAADLEIAVREIVQEINAAALSRADRGLNLLRNAALDVLGHDGSGRRYGKHVASAPGQPPAPQFSSLRNNWHQQKLAQGHGGGVRIIMRIKSNVAYSKFLEHGTSRMLPRPYHDRIKNKAKPQIASLFSSL